MDKEAIRAHAKVLVGYSAAFTFAVLLQLKIKKGVAREFKAKKKAMTDAGQDVKDLRYNRYTDEDPLLKAADRGVGNFVEWAPAFLSLFLANAAVTGDATKLGWAYVALRVLYPILAVNGGISLAGAKPLIYLSTVPMYIVLTLLSVGVLREFSN